MFSCPVMSNMKFLKFNLLKIIHNRKKQHQASQGYI